MRAIDRIDAIVNERKKTDKSFSASKMMKDLGFSSGVYSQWKSGKSIPSRKTIEAIAEYLGTTPEHLEYGSEPTEKETPIQSDERSGNDYVPLLQQFNLLPKDLQRQALNDMMQAYLDNPELLK